MRISDWSSDVCSSDLDELLAARRDFALPREEVDRFPALEHLWLVGGEPGAHRKIGLRQEDGGTIVDANRAVLLNWCRVNGCRVNGCRVNGCRIKGCRSGKTALGQDREGLDADRQGSSLNYRQ